MANHISRLAQMRGPELRFRLQRLLRTATDRVATTVAGAHWRRAALARALAPTADLAPVTDALAAARWGDAHQRLAARLIDGARRFPIHPADAPATAQAIRSRYPGAAADAAALAAPLLEGRRRLLGFTQLDFGQPPDWHLDPVHGRRSPLAFWADVPYLDPAIGDHKIIWELNRHQHWLVLGRAWWLTGDRRYRDTALGELAHWLDANPPLTGINWASSLELGLRCLSWTWAAHLFVRREADETPWLVDLLLALDRQLTQVERNLSYYFSPNTHLTGEALALFVCGHAFPELAASPRRIERGRAILLEAIRLQVETDGGHSERSTHYHRYTLDFYLLALAVARICDDPGVPAFTAAVERLAAAAQLLADDGHRLPHIGDDDGGVLFPMCGRDADRIDDSLSIAAALTGRPDLSPATTPEEALWMLSPTPADAGAAPAPPKSGALPATGYFVMRAPGGEHIVVDAGPHGYLNGGHAHADALSLTLSVAGTPLLVDPGTGTYTTDPVLRDRFRSTAAHNTVVLDGRSQSETAGPFHWRRVADGRASCWHTSDHFDYFEGVHTGYAPAGHRRHVLSLHRDLLLVVDAITGAGGHQADVYWHIDPAWHISPGPDAVRLQCGGRDVQIASSIGSAEHFSGDAAAGLGWYSPAYGRIDPLTTLRWTCRGDAPLWACTVFGLDPANPVTAVAAGAMMSGALFQIRRAHSVDVLVVTEPSNEARLWQTQTVDADARVLFHRTGAAGDRIVIVDGSRIVLAGDPPLRVRCAARQPGLEISWSRPGTGRRTPAVPAVQVSGATADAQIFVNDHPLAGMSVHSSLAGVP